MQRGLVDHVGGLTKALRLAHEMSDLPPLNETKCLRYQTIQEFRGGIPFLGGGARGSLLGSMQSAAAGEPMVLCDDAIACTGLVGADSLGVKPVVAALGLEPSLSYALSHTPLGGVAMAAVELYAGAKSKVTEESKITGFLGTLSNILERVVDSVEDFILL